MAEKLEVQLERVQAAIAAIESGAQEYRIGGRSLRRADLVVLYQRERDLKQQMAEQQYGSRTYAGWDT
jgi:hypothetical protein